MRLVNPFRGKLLILLLLVSYYIEIPAQTPKAKRSFKTLHDTSYQVGDLIQTPEIIFSLSSCELVYEHRDSVLTILNFIKRHPNFRIEIGVHTDVRGKPQQNLRLSACRAKTLADYLIKNFNLPSSAIQAKGYGGTQPLFTDVEIKKYHSPHINYHQMNRRVEIKILEVK